MNIKVYSQAAIKLKETKIIYFDPYQIGSETEKADFIFITHDHYDHYEEESIKKILSKDTILIIPKCLEEKAKKLTPNVQVVEPNNTYEASGITFSTIPAYNIEKPYHPKEKEYVGYNVLIDGTSYYIMGDTDWTKEADEVKTDICFVPIGGVYTMDVDEAAQYINARKPKIAIPIHYGSIVGDISLKDKWQKQIDKNIETKIYIK